MRWSDDVCDIYPKIRYGRINSLIKVSWYLSRAEHSIYRVTKLISASFGWYLYINECWDHNEIDQIV